MTLRLVGVLVALSATACSYPGKADLQSNGFTRTIPITGDYRAVGQCAADRFNNEPWSIDGLVTPVTVFHQRTDVEKLEMASADGGIYDWTIDLTPTEAVLVARSGKKYSLTMPSDYMIEKIDRTIRSCLS